MTHVVVWGELLWDRFPNGDRLGGAPANVATHLARLGAPTTLITRVGRDVEGDRAIAALPPELDRSRVQRDDTAATGEVLITLDGMEPTYQLVPGRAWERIQATPEACQAVAGAGVLTFGTLSQRTDAGKASFAKLLAATPPTCLRVCDPNLRPGDIDAIALRQALDAADVVKLGAWELTAAAASLGEPDLLARLRRQARWIAVTRGEAGATLYDGDLTQELEALAATPGGDAVGCGDAFTAALAFGLARGWLLPRAADLGRRLAAHVASHRGATPPLSAAQVRALTAEV